MSLESSQAELRTRCRDLAQAVTELVTIVHEDRPHGSEIAVIDALTETVSELQAAAIRADELLAQVEEARSLPSYLASVDGALGQVETTYWRDLVAYRPLVALRRAAHEHGREWLTWQRSIELSLGRCELALTAARTALRSAWSEVSDVLTHYTHAGAGVPSPRTTPSENSTRSRRQS
jgi:hypothetical protein